MPPVPSVRGDRVVPALERAGLKSLGSTAVTTSCATPMAAAPQFRFMAATLRRERYAASWPTSA